MDVPFAFSNTNSPELEQGLPLGSNYESSRAAAGEGRESPGPSWLLACVQPGHSHHSSELNVLGGEAGVSCLSRGGLHFYTRASRTSAIRHFIGSFDLGPCHKLPIQATSRPPRWPALFRLTAAEMNII